MIIKLILLLALLYLNSNAQSDSVLINIDQTIEDLIEEHEEETDNSDLYEIIEYYLENPVDINTAAEKELIKLPYLNQAAAQLIVAHRSKYGNYFSTNELYSVKDLPEEMARKIIPFLSADKPKQAEKQPIEKARPISVKIRNRIIRDVQEKKGFTDHIFIGTPEKIYNRVDIEYNRYLKAGFSTEKDAGEKSLYDYLSGYMSLTESFGLKKILIGDYHVHFGQGLALWNSYGFSKSSDAVFSTKKSAGTIKASSGSDEINYFRGAAINFAREHAEITGFYSRKSLDAAVDSVHQITSLAADGFHRTQNERIKQNSVEETSVGMIMTYAFTSRLSGGLLYYKSRFNHPYIASKVYDMIIDNFNYYSGYIDILLNNINIYGEISYFNKSEAAYITGLQFNPSTEFCYSMLIHNYPLTYLLLHGGGFASGSGARNNESGIYNGIRWRTSIGTLNFYYDQFKYPNATFTNPLPSEGNEFMIRLSTRLISKCEAGIKIRISNKETASQITGEEKMVKRLKQSVRLEYSYNFTNKLRLKTRLEYISVLLKDPHSREEGYLCFEDIRYVPADGLLLYGRIIFFRTNSFNSAIYEYENDLTGIISSRGLYGEGFRFYAAARYQLSGKVSLSLKYSETFKPKEKSSGSGYQQIEGNMDNRIGLQADFTF